MALELVSLGTLTVSMPTTHVIPASPAGTRVIVDFADIRWTGGRIEARQKGVAAGDWLSIGPEGTAVLDIRFALETHDGALIYVHGGGRTDSATFAQGAPVYFAPVFETGDARYAWLNRVQAVARGTASGKTVTFEVYEVR